MGFGRLLAVIALSALLVGLYGFVALTLPGSVQAEDYFVAPDGSDGAVGSRAAPFASIGRAQQAASAGDTVWIRGGRYRFSGTAPGSEVGVQFEKSGRSGAPIRYWAFPGESPVFDFYQLKPPARIRGFQVRASWLHFRGLELVGVQQTLVEQNESWAIRLESGASHNVFEQLNLHHHEGPGLFIADGGDNLVLNVDSHHNYDPDRGGENADGFGCHSNDGGNVFRGCRAWSNSDDGYDFINSPGVCVVESCWAFRNGFRPDTTIAAGNGAGIKAGGFTTRTLPSPIPRHIVRHNVSWSNRAQGFYANHHEGGIDWLHNTAYENGRNFDMLADEGRAEHLLRNNVAYGRGGNLERATTGEIDSASNSWDRVGALSGGDFESVSDDGCDGPRGPDGALPWLPFLRPHRDGRLVDRGVDLGAAYVGTAPDLGAFEFGAATGPPPPDGPPDAAVGIEDAGLPQGNETGAEDGGRGAGLPVDAAVPKASVPPEVAGGALWSGPTGGAQGTEVPQSGGGAAVSGKGTPPTASHRSGCGCMVGVGSEQPSGQSPQSPGVGPWALGILAWLFVCRRRVSAARQRSALGPSPG